MTDARDDPAVSRIAELAAETDREFAAIQERRGAQMECRAGCSACCRARLSITRAEEAFLRAGIERLPVEVRRRMARQAQDPAREMCPALDDEGRCQVYDSRPLICRSYGVPLRRRRDVALINPPVIDVCDKNFAGASLKMLPAADVIDQTRLEERVAAIDDEYCERRQLPPGGRVPIAQILSTPDP